MGWQAIDRFTHSTPPSIKVSVRVELEIDFSEVGFWVERKAGIHPGV